MEQIEQTGEAYSSQNIVSKEEVMEEEMFLGLRKVAGVSKSIFYKKFNIQLVDVFPEQIANLVKLGLIVNDDQSIRLTHKGKLLGNEVFQEFIGLS
jgi:oxygen-independent coproporphyrinogen-3 oxidase